MNHKLIFTCLSGSHLYGTNKPNSDIDICGVCFPLRKNILGMQKFEQWQPNTQESIEWSQQFELEADDICIYGLEKFMKLCGDANPNIIELLFAPPLYKTSVWDRIIQNRQWFMSQKIIHTFSGYAYSQLKRIKTHKKWLDDPPTKPNPQDYGYKNSDWKSRNQQNKYKKLSDDYQRYQTWLNTRNPKRLELEQKYGYDCYVEETEFLTDNGWKNFNDITPNDKLATVYTKESNTCHKFLSIEYQHYVEKFSGVFSGNLYKFFGHHTDVQVTPNHRMLYFPKIMPRIRSLKWLFIIT